MVLLLSVPIEAVLAAADVKADAGALEQVSKSLIFTCSTIGMYEKKSNQTAAVFLLYNFVTLGLLGSYVDSPLRMT